MSLFQNIKDWFMKALKIAPVVISIASGITAVLPNPSPQASQALIIAHNILDVIALNVANNAPNNVIPAPLQGNNNASNN